MNTKPNTYTWTAWVIAAMTIAVLTYNPLYHTLLLLILVIVSIKHTLPFLKILHAGVFFGLPLLLINILLVHHGEHVIYTIPKQAEMFGQNIHIPFLSGPITLESIGAALIFMLVLVNMMLIFSIYNNVTTPDNILRLIPKSLSHSTLLVALTLRFIPTLASDAQSIRDAQRCRGLKSNKGDFVERLRNNLALIIPTFINSLERSYSLAEALESRGYSRERTRYFTEQWTTRDKVLTTLFLVGMVYLVVARLSGNLSYWNALSPLTGMVKPNPAVVTIILTFALP